MIIAVTKSKRMKWTGLAAIIRKRNACNIAA
jgi:hypothetical protein